MLKEKNKIASFYILLFLIFPLLLPTSTYSQGNNLINSVFSDKQDSFLDIQKKFKVFNESNSIKNGLIKKGANEEKVPNWKIFKRWEYYWEQRVNPITGEFPKTSSIDEFEKYKANHQNKSTSGFTGNWTSLGTNYSTGGYAGIGRINCIAFHPTDNNTFWVGSPSGGLWKTTDGGASWNIINNDQPVLGVSCIVIPSDFATSNTMYIATGDRDGGSLWTLSGEQAADNPSTGVFKSVDGGLSWSPTSLTYTQSQKKLVFKLLVHPTNPQILFAATTDGIKKSTDGGNTWVTKNGNRYIDMEFNPSNPSIIYASTAVYGSCYVFRSTNEGENWYTSATITNGRRGEMAVTPDNPNIIYLLVANTAGGALGVYKSTDNGANFSKVNTNTTQSMLGYYSDGSGDNSGQGSYDWCIAASPIDENLVFIGGVTTWFSTDGGLTWAANNSWTESSYYNKTGIPVVHADKHALEFQNGTTLFEGNDGGIYKTTNSGTSWTDLTNGMVTSQIYRIGVSKTDISKILAGLQDNGSKKYNGAMNTWKDVYGGDGMECIIDNNNATSYMYVTYISGQIYRNDNAFSNSITTKISANIPGGQPDGAWVAPYIMNPNNSSTLFAGYDRVWKTTNRGNSWTQASQILSSTDLLRSLVIAPSNPDILYTADKTHLWKTTDGGATDWVSVTLPFTSSSVTNIAVKADDPNTVWLVYGGYTNDMKVFQSNDGGLTWVNISTGLPNLPVLTIVQNKNETTKNVLFAGTDAGVFIKDGTNDWELFSTGLPSVVITELEMFYAPGVTKLVAGTFGRGLWITDVISSTPVVGTPVLHSPANTSVDNSLHPLLKWYSVAGASEYTVQLFTDTTASPVFESTLQDTACLVSKILNNNTTYFWRVKTAGGSYSDYFSFTTWNAIQAYLYFPIDNATVYTLSPVLTWSLQMAYNGILFDVLVSTDSLFSSGTTQVYSALAANQYTLSNLLPGTHYFWRVRLKNSTGSIISYSQVEDFTTYGAAETPIPTWPVNNATVYTLNPMLNWYMNSPVFSYTYEVRFKTNSSAVWSSPISCENNIYAVLSSLIAGTAYDWQVRANNGTTYSNWSAAQTFVTYGSNITNLPVPVLSYPVSGVTVYSVSPALYWYINQYSANIDYSVLVSKNSDFSNPVLDTNGVSSLYAQLSALEPGTKYYWKARSHSGTNYSAWSQVDSFVTYGITGNFEAVLTYPLGGVTVYSNTPSLYWYSLGGVPGTGYEVQYSKTNGVFTNTLTTSSTAITLPVIDYGVKYYWRVRGVNGSVYSSWSHVDSFEVTGNGSSLVPVLTWPIGGALSSTSPTLYWYTNSYISNPVYQIEYAENSNFDSSIVVTSNSAYKELSGLGNGKTYYWRVRTYNGNVYSPYSTAATFTTAAGTTPSRPICGSPINGVIINTSAPVISWFQPVPGTGNTYELQYSNSPSFVNPVTISNIEGKSFSSSNLTGTIFWRVRSKSPEGIYSQYSNAERFTSANLSSNDNTNIQPKDFALLQNYPNPFNPVTTIRFDLPERSNVRLTIYNQVGEKVEELTNRSYEAGEYSVRWNATKYPSGIYFYEIRTDKFSSVKKLLLLK